MVVSMQPVVSVTSLKNVTVGVLQPSETVTSATFGAGIVPLHPARVMFAGQEMEGGVLSIVRVNVCEQVAAFPQASTALYVRTVTSTHPVVSITSLTNDTVAFPQPSETVTSAILGAGTVPLHPARVTFAGQEMEGGVLSRALGSEWE